MVKDNDIVVCLPTHEEICALVRDGPGVPSTATERVGPTERVGRTEMGPAHPVDQDNEERRRARR